MSEIDISKMNSVIHTVGFKFQLSRAFEGTFDSAEIDFIIDAIKQRVNRNIR